MSSTARAAKDFLKFVNASPSPFHAVEQCRTRLLGQGFTELSEKSPWKLEHRGKYFFTRNQSTIVAFVVPPNYAPGQSGCSIVAAHTDSPCLKIKPHSKQAAHGYSQVGVQTYGGGLWHTWFDRDLTVAGRLVLRDSNNADAPTRTALVHIKRPILRVPNLAIHLTSGSEREAFKFNKEENLTPIIATQIKEQLGFSTETDQKQSTPSKKRQRTAASNSNNSSTTTAAAATTNNAAASGPGSSLPTSFSSGHHPALFQLLSNEAGVHPDQIVDFELCLADCQPAQLGGLHEEFIFSPRLDNLFSCFCALEALVQRSSDPSLDQERNIRMVACFDHEEVGSESAQGAASQLMESLLRRLCQVIPGSDDSKSGSAAVPRDAFECSVRRSFLLSVDMAHAVHPNYSAKHEAQHRPSLHSGPVLKFNANQRYATNDVSAGLVRGTAARAGVPLQEFVVRNDSPCGSTIGPIMAARCGIRTADLGAPQLSMHSIREMAATDDVQHLIDLSRAFFEHFTAIDAEFQMD